ncbi:hypothetical protein ACIQ6K_15695 [Streptomyces sp. NPDC096354]
MATNELSGELSGREWSGSWSEVHLSEPEDDEDRHCELLAELGADA